MPQTLCLIAPLPAFHLTTYAIRWMLLPKVPHSNISVHIFSCGGECTLVPRSFSTLAISLCIKMLE